MKNFIKLIIALLLFTIHTGCKKVLEEKSFSTLAASDFPKTTGDLRVLCNGLYSLFEANEHYGRSYIILSDLFSDELTTPSLSGPRYEMQFHLITPINSEVAMFWQRNYIIIARANFILQKAPTIGLSEESVNPYLAEARFIRAHCYFELVKMFGDVPLIVKQPVHVDSLQALKPKRTPKDQVYKQIVEDLKFAEQYLPKESAISGAYRGIASTGAATATLAKVYLTRAYLPFKEAEDFQNAATACEKVMNSKEYDLFPSYPDVFDVNKESGFTDPVTKKNVTEHIFSIQYDRAPNRSGGMTGFLAPPQVYPRAFGSFPAERKFYDNFPAEDVIRKDFVFYDQGVGISGTTYDFITSAVTSPFCAKYRDNELAATSFNDRCNYPILRYADVLLMHSEALNRINPADNNKYMGINKVRQRVNLSALSGLDQNEFEDAVLNERHWELCFEGKRRDDLIRMGKLVPVMTALGFTNIKDTHRYYPVPQTEIDLNENLKPQNLGY